MGSYGILWDVMIFLWDFMKFMGFYGMYPLVMANVAMENDHRSSDLPIENGDFQ